MSHIGSLIRKNLCHESHPHNAKGWGATRQQKINALATPRQKNIRGWKVHKDTRRKWKYKIFFVVPWLNAAFLLIENKASRFLCTLQIALGERNTLMHFPGSFPLFLCGCCFLLFSFGGATCERVLFTIWFRWPPWKWSDPLDALLCQLGKKYSPAHICACPL